MWERAKTNVGVQGYTKRQALTFNEDRKIEFEIGHHNVSFARGYMQARRQGGWPRSTSTSIRATNTSTTRSAATWVSAGDEAREAATEPPARTRARGKLGARWSPTLRSSELLPTSAVCAVCTCVRYVFDLLCFCTRPFNGYSWVNVQPWLAIYLIKRWQQKSLCDWTWN